MRPDLFKIFTFPVHSYGVMLALSFLIGIWISSIIAKKRNLNPEIISDMGFWIIISAIIGARLYYVILHYEEFKGNFFSIINPFQAGQVGIGGLVMLGGFIGAIIAGVIFFKIKKLPFLPYADALSPGVGIGIFLTRIGCFLNGCCYGAPSEGACSIHFSSISPAGYFQEHMHATSLYPSQLFESAGGLVIAAIIFFIGTRKVFIGLQFYMLGVLYAVLRFFVDYSRYYSPDERPFGILSHNQLICIVMFVIFGGLILKNTLFKEDLKEASSQPPLTSSGQLNHEQSGIVEKK